MLNDARTVYVLTRRQGKPADLYDWSTTIETRTGVQTIHRTRYSLKRVVRLPDTMVWKVVRMTVKGDAPFKYSMTDAMFLVRKSEVPYVPSNGNYIIQDGKRWNILEVKDYSISGAYVFTCRHLAGENLGQVIDVLFKDVIDFSETLTENGE